MNVFAATHAIGHPVGIMIGLAGMLFNGVFERFPGLRVGFLEGGVGWFLMALERFNGSYGAFTPFDPRGELLKLPDGMDVGDYMLSLCRQGRIRVGVEGDEPSLSYAVHVAGPEAFIFSSDIPARGERSAACRTSVEPRTRCTWPVLPYKAAFPTHEIEEAPLASSCSW